MVRIWRAAAVIGAAALVLTGAGGGALFAQDGGAGAAPRTADLTPKFTGDAEHLFHIEGVEKSRQPTPQGQLEGTRTTSMKILRRGTGLKERGASFEAIIKSYKERQESKYGSIEFDSEQPAEKDAGNPLAAQYRPLINAAIGLEADLQGAIKSVRLSPALAAAGWSDRERVKKLFEPFFRVKETAPYEIPVGDTWTKETTEEVEFATITYTTEYTLERIEDGVAVIPFEMSVRSAMKPGAPADAPRLESASASGAVRWNLDDGVLDRMELKQSIDAMTAQGEIHREETKIITRVRDAEQEQ